MGITNEQAEQLMKEIQRGFGGHNALDEAHNCLAACYGTIGALLNDREDLLKNQARPRTEKQSSSRWVYLDAMATQFNDAGFDRQKVITRIKETAKVDAQNTQDSMYIDYWRPVHDALYPEVKRLNTQQIQVVFEAMNNHSAKAFGISGIWPDKHKNWQDNY